MTPPINIDGSTVDAITIDGTEVTEVTADGEVVFGSAIPDSVAQNMDTLYGIDAGSGTDIADLLDSEPASTDANWITGSEWSEDTALNFEAGERLRSDNQVDLNGSAQSVAGWFKFDAFEGRHAFHHMGDQTSGSESRDDGWYVRAPDSSTVEILDGKLGGAGASIQIQMPVSLSTGSQYFIAAACSRTDSTDSYDLFVYDNSQLLNSASTTASNRVTTAGTYYYNMREPSQSTVDGQADYTMFNTSEAVSQSVFDDIHSDTRDGR